MKIVTVVGARPQFIKAAILSDCLRQRNVREVVIHTGQHYDDNMSTVFFRELGIREPDYNLDVGSGSHGMQTARMLEGIENALLAELPDWVLIYGDTNSTLAAALAASKLNIPIAHVEAGMRSFDSEPEEINRVVADCLSSLLFAPCENARRNLLREGVRPASIFVTGDIMADASLLYADRAERRSKILQALNLPNREYILATVHRATNTADNGRLPMIVAALMDLAETIPVVLPLHPRTRQSLAWQQLLEQMEKALRVIAPVGYLDMIMLEKHARLVVTDSGGVQKESFYYGVPCVTLRERTEWTELVELGWNRLVAPFGREEIVRAARTSLQTRPTHPGTPYGRGSSGKQMADLLLVADRLIDTELDRFAAISPTQQ